MMKRTLAFLFAVILIFLTACGDGIEQSVSGSKQEQGGTDHGPQFAYQATYFPIEAEDTPIQYINNLCLSGNTLFFTASCQTGTEIMKDEITGETYLDENGQPIEGPVTETFLFSMDLNTQELRKHEMPTFKPAEGSFGGSYFGSMSQDSQGGIWISEQTNSYRFDLPEDFDLSTGDYYQYYVDEGTQTLCHHFDAQGNLDKTITLELPEGSYIGEVLFLADGSMYTTDWTNVYRFDENGKIQGELAVENGVNMLFPYSDTQMGVSLWTDDGNVLKPIDPSTMTLGEGFAMPANAYRLFRGFGAYTYLYYNNDMVFGIKEGEETGEKILSWLDADVDSSYLSNYAFTDDGTCYAIENQYDSETGMNDYQLLRMDRVDASTIPQKQELTLQST